VVPNIARLLETDSHRVWNNTVGLLADAATVHSDAVESHMDSIAAFLSDDDASMRMHATAALSRVAADFPEVIELHIPALVGP
jgi:glutamate racemase